MIGPGLKKMPDKRVCTGCEVVISKELGGRRPRTVNYCSHEGLKPDCEVSFIKGFPYTPKWCPAK